MPLRVENIRRTLEAVLAPTRLDIEDDSHRHAGHAGAKGATCVPWLGGADQPLPPFYWTGKTDMNCLRHALRQTLRFKPTQETGCLCSAACSSKAR